MSQRFAKSILVLCSIFVSFIWFSSRTYAAWTFETTHDDPVIGDWDDWHIGNSLWGDLTLDTDIKQEGTASYKFENSHVCPVGFTDNYVYKKFTSTGKHYTVKAWYRYSGFVGSFGLGNDDILTIMAPEDDPEPIDPEDWWYLLNVVVNSTGKLKVEAYWDSSSFSTQSLTPNTWHELELTLFEDETNGSYSLKVDGVEWLADTGLETTDSYQTSDSRILVVGSFNGACYSSADHDLWVDDVRWYRGDTAYSEEPEPEPSPTSTPAPSPTLTPSASSTTTTASQSRSAPQCTAEKPSGLPDLYQITSSATTATLYFAPPQSPFDRYFVAYGLQSGDVQYGTEFLLGPTCGAVSYTLSHLQPSTNYVIRVRAGNRCMPGDWSNELNIRTTKNPSSMQNFYK